MPRFSAAVGNNSRVLGLDVLRASAVLFVVYGHGYYLIQADVSKYLYKLPEFDGVTIFFVLSGFLIGRILLRTMAQDDINGKMLVEFWIRRWFRTLPNYFAVLAFLILSFALLGLPLPGSLIRFVFFSQNLASPHPDFFVEAWSLAVEEWFYLCVPVLFYLCTKLRNIDRRKAMLFLMTSIIIVVTAFRFYRAYKLGYTTIEEWDEGLRKQIVTRLDSIMYGVVGAYLSLYRQHFWKRIARISLVVGMSLLILDKAINYTAPNIFYLNYVSLTLNAVGALLLLPLLSSWKNNSGRLARVMTFVSLVSYSMYLLHFTAVQKIILPLAMHSVSAFCWRCSQSLFLEYVLYWTITVTGSFLLYRYFERPTTALREAWHPRGKTAMGAFHAFDAGASSGQRGGA